MSQNQDVVVDKAQFRWSDLWKREDYWAIWLGLAFSLLSLYLYLFSFPADKLTEHKANIAQAEAVMEAEAAKAPFKTIEWYQAQAGKKVKSVASEFAGSLKTYMGTPGSWTHNPMEGLRVTKEQAEAKAAAAKPAADKAKAAETAALAAARMAQDAAAAADFKDASLNDAADQSIQDWRAAQRKADKAQAKTRAKTFNLFTTLPVLFLGLAIAFGLGTSIMGQQKFTPFFFGFIGVFVFTVVAMLLGSWSVTKYYGVSTEAWAILVGMLVANTVGTPKWMKPALQVEFFIKTGLVLLGCEILLDKIIAIGIPGLFVAWVVTPIVLISTYIFGQKVIKMPSKTLNITISADMSVCGTSAAIAAAAACRAKKEELALSIGISLLFTAVMMIVMPVVIKFLGMPDILGGAWIGGTIDSTGAVAAAGAFLGERAMFVAATIKMIQNVLIGVSAFCIAVYWVTKVDRVEGAEVHFVEVWHRFPKFVLGFLATSLIFSYYSGQLGHDLSGGLITAGAIKSGTALLRAWCFTLSFAAIGLATNFRELATYFKGGKPVILYICGQSLNLALTLAMAYTMFYIVFPEITARI